MGYKLSLSASASLLAGRTTQPHLSPCQEQAGFRLVYGGSELRNRKSFRTSLDQKIYGRVQQLDVATF